MRNVESTKTSQISKTCRNFFQRIMTQVKFYKPFQFSKFFRKGCQHVMTETKFWTVLNKKSYYNLKISFQPCYLKFYLRSNFDKLVNFPKSFDTVIIWLSWACNIYKFLSYVEIYFKRNEYFRITSNVCNECRLLMSHGTFLM